MESRVEFNYYFWIILRRKKFLVQVGNSPSLISGRTGENEVLYSLIIFDELKFSGKRQNQSTL